MGRSDWLIQAILTNTENSVWFHVQESGMHPCLFATHINTYSICWNAATKNGEYVHLLSWALHEIKRTNPCNMHDEIHEYVEGKKGLWKILCRAYTVGACKITANFKHSTKRETTTFPQRQTTTAYSQWAQSSGRDKPIMLHASLRTWHYYEMPTWAVRWHGRAKWTYTVCVCPHLCVCVYMSECVWICASLSERVVLHVTVPVCISRNASLVKWGSTHHVVSCVCCCHGSRLPWEELRWKGRGERRRIVRLDSVVYLSVPSMGKTQWTAEKFPTTHCSLSNWATIQKGTPGYEWI